MSIRSFTVSQLVLVLSSVVVLACGGSDDSGSGKGAVTASGGQIGAAGGAGGLASGGTFPGGGGSPGGAPQGGVSGGGQPSGPTCGLEVCTGSKQCCPSTGKCYDKSFEGCSTISCTITSNDTGGGTGSGGAANCCTMGLLHCASNNICYHPACVGCCP